MFSILVVDNSRLIRERIIDHLLDLGNVEVIGDLSDGNDVIPFIFKYKPDLVILDINIPSKDGFEIVKELRTYILDTIIIVFTGFPNTQYRKYFKRLGVKYFFDKTTDFNNMISLIQILSTIERKQNSVIDMATN